jgi:hypothetical protein
MKVLAEKDEFYNFYFENIYHDLNVNELVKPIAKNNSKIKFILLNYI